MSVLLFLILILIFSSEKLVPVSELSAVNAVELITCHSVGPVTLCNAGLVDTGIAAVKEKVLNGKNKKICVGGKHCTKEMIVASVVVCSRVAAVVEYSSSGFIVKIPNVAEKSVVVVSSCVCYTVVGIVVREVRRVVVADKAELQYSHSGET